MTYNSVTNYFEGSVDLISSDENGLWYVGNVLLTDKSGKTNSYYYKTATSSTNYVFESSALTNIPIGGKVEKK